MPQIIPLLRFAALMPLMRWAQQNRRDVTPTMRAAGLPSFSDEDIERPVSFVAAAEFLRKMQSAEGPDFCCRAVRETSVSELGTFGLLALGARTPREALKRVARLSPFYSTHAVFSIVDGPGELVFRVSLALSLDDESRHAAHQYLAALVRSLCRLSGARDPVFRDVRLAPHPVHGLEHLQPWFGGHLRRSSGKGLLLAVGPKVADRPFPDTVRRLGRQRPPDGWNTLWGDGTFVCSARTVLSGLHEEGLGTVEHLAAASGMSIRSLQRRLSDDGTSFKALSEELRRETALRRLSEQTGPAIGEISASLGYSSQSALTRAVRRWTGRVPRDLRPRR